MTSSGYGRAAETAPNFGDSAHEGEHTKRVSWATQPHLPKQHIRKQEPARLHQMEKLLLSKMFLNVCFLPGTLPIVVLTSAWAQSRSPPGQEQRRQHLHQCLLQMGLSGSPGFLAVPLQRGGRRGPTCMGDVGTRLRAPVRVIRLRNTCHVWLSLLTKAGNEQR